jgi:threonine/homoserine/homoserine lactone efflux protein
MSELERRYRRLVRMFPRAWRQDHQDDLVATLVDRSEPGQRYPVMEEVLDLVRSAAVVRLQHWSSRSAPPPSAPPLGALLLLALSSALVVGVLVTGRVSGQFLITSLLVALVPGTGVVYTVSAAVTGGWQRGLPAAVGCTLGIVPHVSAAVLGLSGLLQTGALAFEVVRWLGVAYLAAMGIEMVLRGGQLSFDPDPATGLGGGDPSSVAPPGGGGAASGATEAGTWTSTIMRAVLLNLLNPKLTVFFFAFLPQFLASPPQLLDLRLVGLGAVFMAITLAVFLVYAWVCAVIRRRVVEQPGLVAMASRALGAVLVGFAVRLATSER